jgi:hypothetical protein
LVASTVVTNSEKLLSNLPPAALPNVALELTRGLSGCACSLRSLARCYDSLATQLGRWLLDPS